MFDTSFAYKSWLSTPWLGQFLFNYTAGYIFQIKHVTEIAYF